MEKPVSLKVRDAERELVKIINESEMPAFILKPIIEKIYKQLEIIEQRQLESDEREYKASLVKEESDKNGTKQKRTTKV